MWNNIAFWIPKATNTHSQYVTFIAFPLQQWLHERASILRHSTLSVFLGYRSGEAAVFVLLGHALCNWVIGPRRFETTISKRRGTRQPGLRHHISEERKPLVFLSSLLPKAH